MGAGRDKKSRLWGKGRHKHPAARGPRHRRRSHVGPSPARRRPSSPAAEHPPQAWDDLPRRRLPHETSPDGSNGGRGPTKAMPELSTDDVDTCFAQIFKGAAGIVREDETNSFA